MSDFTRTAERIRNWGRWGADDELGTLNFITPAKLVESAGLVRQGKLFALGADFDAQGPQGTTASFRTNPIHLMTIDGGDAAAYADMVRGWGHETAERIWKIFDGGPMRFNDDYVIMPLQAATQWDALSHVYYDEQLYNGYPAASVTSFGATRCSIDKVDVKGVTSRAVLLDVARHRGGEFADPATPILPAELEAIASKVGVDLGTGDILLVRTGWYGGFHQQPRNRAMAAAGLSWTCAEWMHGLEIAAVAADNVAVEHSRSEVDGAFLPMHMLCLRDMGMMFGEIWDLDALAADCAGDGIYEFQLIASPLRVTGAVGSPLNPIALK
jgi:kynurenine formamidase